MATEAAVAIKSPNNYTQIGNRPDNVTVRSVFIGEIKAKTVAIWIIILSIIAGLLLLLLLIAGLVKVRQKKKNVFSVRI